MDTNVWNIQCLKYFIFGPVSVTQSLLTTSQSSISGQFQSLTACFPPPKVQFWASFSHSKPAFHVPKFNFGPVSVTESLLSTLSSVLGQFQSPKACFPPAKVQFWASFSHWKPAFHLPKFNFGPVSVIESLLSTCQSSILGQFQSLKACFPPAKVQFWASFSHRKPSFHLPKFNQGCRKKRPDRVECCHATLILLIPWFCKSRKLRAAWKVLGLFCMADSLIM